MALDPNAVGAHGPLREIEWTVKDTLLYAVGIGAGRDDLAFTTENSVGIEHQVYPTFAVVAGLEGTELDRTALGHIGSFDPALLVHGTQAVTLYRPIPADGAATSQDRIVALYDKGKAAVVVVRTETASADGSRLWSLESSAYIRGAGGWGGDRGPSGPRNEPPDRAPDDEVTMTVSPDQAFVYRLSGDRNPLHTDPAFAAKGGFDRPILHGLCTFGFTGRALLRALCQDKVERLEHIEGRFSAPVWPGETLTVRCWRVAGGQAVFTTAVGDRTVLDQGLARFREGERVPSEPFSTN